MNGRQIDNTFFLLSQVQFSLELKFFDRTVELAKTLPLTDWLEKSNIRPGKIETFLLTRRM